MVVAALSTGHEIGLALVAAVFIGFALVSSMVVPRRRPDFPGRAGLRVFVIASLALFAATIAAVAVFGRESEAKAGTPAAATGAATAQATLTVKEKEFKILLPAAARTLKPGRTTFVAENVGKLPHDLTIKGPGVRTTKTPLIQPGKKASLTVKLAKGTYVLWCSVPGHEKLGMRATITVA